MENVELTPEAEEDLTGIWLYTFETWGFDQAETYYGQIVGCCEAIGLGNAHSCAIEGLDSGLRVHRCQQHYIFYLTAANPIIIAILHGRMDFIKRLHGRLG